ncbi:thymidylate kinase [Neokomagataea thailandica NBRC 106555]|uniref:Thymidylate kinase n=2 Tax=Neokomagataea TaxID=1223423 RepID=A0A4Y6V612_9PROT|nr:MULTISPECIES: dTMP kinase [Neokomagataea]QDH23937.1 dTMP kinase [Neokomagataea tanensis]GBR54518.1 thymidylate kinase [Neokomagataea thailandica NBRC 106555]
MDRPTKHGLFVTLEGGEGAGKSTQARRLSDALQALGYETLLTREPGGTPGAEALRNLLLHGSVSLSWRAEILTLLAARSDHLDTAILPALKRGVIVICDRFHDSTFAYQGYGIGEAAPERLSFIAEARRFIQCDPDVTLLLELPREIARERLTARGGPGDRYEDQVEAFHVRVSEGFSVIADAEPLRVRRIDAGLEPDDVTQSLVQAVLTEFQGRQ